MRTFINDFRSGTLNRFYKSEPIPEEYISPSKVMPIVGKTWHQKVNDPVRDVFVVYVSQYCMKCR